MTEINDRLQYVRKKAGFESATEAAESYGWNVNTYRSHENGARGLRFEALSRYARAFNASVTWLLTGAGAETDTFAVRIAGSVKDRCIVENAEQERVQTDIFIGFSVPRNALALLVETDSLYPKYIDGDVLLVWNSPISEKTLSSGGDIMIEGLVQVSEELEVLGSINPSRPDMVEFVGRPPMRDAMVLRFLPVQAVVRFGMASLTAFLEPPLID